MTFWYFMTSKYMSAVKYLLMVFVALFYVSACADHSQTAQLDHSHSTDLAHMHKVKDSKGKDSKGKEGRSYQKPGAPIEFEHNYKGRSQAGEPEQITLRFRYPSNSGALNVTIESDEGLELAQNLSPYIFTDNKNGEVEIPLDVTASADGKYYLNIFTALEASNGASSGRAFALGLRVGDYTSVEKSNNSVIQTKSGERIIHLPAHETITQ